MVYLLQQCDISRKLGMHREMPHLPTLLSRRCGSSHISISRYHLLNSASPTSWICDTSHLLKKFYSNKILSSLCLDMNCRKTCNVLINQLLFNGNLPSIDMICYETYHGLYLNNSLISHINLRHVHLALETIDDLYLLLNGLIPNVQTLIIELCQSSIPCKLIVSEMEPVWIFDDRYR